MTPPPDFCPDFDRYGYVVIPNAVAPELRAEAHSAAIALLTSNITNGRDRGADGKDGFRGCLALNPDAFLPLIANSTVLPAVAELLTPNIHVVSTQLIALPSIAPGCPRQVRTPERPGWHRDLYGVAADLGHAHTPRLAIKCAYYLSEITPDCGVTMLLPGSHLATDPPNIPAGQVDPPGAITPAIDPAGTDALLFENRTWHAGGLNTSGRPRLALMVQYGYRWLAPIDGPAPQLLTIPDLTAVQRQLLGAPDRNDDGSVAKGRGAEPLRRWLSSQSIQRPCASAETGDQQAAGSSQATIDVSRPPASEPSRALQPR